MMYIQKSAEEISKLYFKDVRKNAYLARSDVLPRVMKLPVCPHCEKPVLKHKGWKAHGTVQCVTCGWTGNVDKTYDLEMHFLDGGATT